ncbi:MAG: hypothetical protein GY820_07305 [Gammaproteobacteria bacterium]|nr:hypothetical protein [Gammaproteobacteria bacterium]
MGPLPSASICNGGAACVEIIDQRRLPHEFVTEELRCVGDAVIAIRDMHVRGAPLIGATAAWGMYLSVVEQGDGLNLNDLRRHGQRLQASRPTAVRID